MGAYCRLFDGSANELARYQHKQGGHESGLIIARLFREPGARWGFQALGSFSKATIWKDAVPDMAAIFRKSPRELQLRGQSTHSLGSDVASSSSGASRPLVHSVSVQSARDGPCCAVQ